MSYTYVHTLSLHDALPISGGTFSAEPLSHSTRMGSPSAASLDTIPNESPYTIQAGIWALCASPSGTCSTSCPANNQPQAAQSFSSKFLPATVFQVCSTRSEEHTSELQ